MSPAPFPAPAASELAAALLLATITAALGALCAYLYRQYRKRYFLAFASALAIYVLRIGAIVGYLTLERPEFLYLHQVLTGWTALALLWSALLVSQQPRWRPAYLAFVLFPPLWSYVAIYRLQNFLLAAGPAVLFLSLATLWTGFVFLRYWRRIRSHGAALLGISFLLWGAHHLDYPLLRARGAWSPWGYYLDILFLLSIGVGVLLFVQDDLRRGLSTLSVLSGELQRGHDDTGDAAIAALLARPLALGGVRGSALYLSDDGRFVRAVGACAQWAGTVPDGAARDAIVRGVETGHPTVARRWDGDDAGLGDHRYVAVLPIFRGGEAYRPAGALVIVGEELDPFTALGDSFLLALGQQVGAALENADLYRRLASRTQDLERLSARMVRQHEDERRQISLELHDETAQVFSAVKMQLGVLRESVSPDLETRIDRALELVDEGIRSIRSVASHLRPPLLDDLGLLAALRALVAEFGERSGLAITLEVPASLPELGEDTELALFRALQEALSNIARHASATRVSVIVAAEDGAMSLLVRDDGRGLPTGDVTHANGRMGLAGMRERLAALGGAMSISSDSSGGGTELRARVPAGAPPSP
ncbi:MAG: GAF domain-containing sensor histidine kinase [Gemmatimonadota bacterium]|nr:GAF domain-containing sensor histidine kinase [Gemmatimonadota bacterium]